MAPYNIDVSKVEELQTIRDVEELERIFERAKSTVVNGVAVVLGRKAGREFQPFDEITTLDDLNTYRLSVFKYL
jgi:hypothetical protein